jgi:hypothetical protein
VHDVKELARAIVMPARKATRLPEVAFQERAAILHIVRRVAAAPLTAWMTVVTCSSAALLEAETTIRAADAVSTS